MTGQKEQSFFGMTFLYSVVKHVWCSESSAEVVVVGHLK